MALCPECGRLACTPTSRTICGVTFCSSGCAASWINRERDSA